jgi:hypothetical protein
VELGISVADSDSDTDSDADVEVVLSRVDDDSSVVVVDDAAVVAASAVLLEGSALEDSLADEDEDSSEEEGSSVVLLEEGMGAVLDVTVSWGGVDSVSTTVVGSGVLVAGLREVMVSVGSGASETFSVEVTWASLAGKKFVVVAPSEARVSMYVLLPRVFVSGVAVEPTMGSHALGPMVSPSCSITVDKVLRWSTTTGGTKFVLGISDVGIIRGAKFVGEGRFKVDVSVMQVVAIAVTSRWLNVA